MQSPIHGELPMEYEVIGEHVNDRTLLLLVGSDRRFYALSLLDGETSETELGEEWILDAAQYTATPMRMATK